MRETRERRRWRRGIAAVAVAAVIVMVSACPTGLGGGDDADPETYAVSFERQGGIGGSTSVTAILGSPMPAATAPSKAGMTFDGYHTEPDGSGTQYYTAEMGSARNWDIEANTELIANYRIHQIGDPGPAGGIVFYDKGEFTEGWRYLEAAPATTEWTKKPWGGSGPGHEVGVSAQGTAIGTGAANTLAIVSEYGDAEPNADRDDYAAKLSDDLSHNGYSDWFLPSKDELELMYQNLYLHGIGDFAGGSYWSSSEYNAGHTWRQGFYVGNVEISGKFYEFRVRGVRAF